MNLSPQPIVLVVLFCFMCCSLGDSDNISYKWPTIGISVLVRNKAHTLPYFLSSLLKLDYPKDRLYIWIYSDHNEDNSLEIVQKWSDAYRREYNNVNINTNVSDSISNGVHEENLPTNWSTEHYKHVIRLREEALSIARQLWADYIFMIDADVFLTDPLTLKHLVNKKFTVTSPMLVSDGLYSNFWCEMSDNYYYKRTDDYKPIVSREKIGCFEVPMVHTAVLVALRPDESDSLTYDPEKIEDYKGPVDDIIAFAVNANKSGITLNLCNDHSYGYIPVPLEDGDNRDNDLEQLLNIKLEAISRGQPLPLDTLMKTYVTYPEMWKFGCSEIYMINLERREERRKHMELSFKELGMDVKLFKAVDGRKMNMEDLSDFSVTLMPNYEDPFYRRPMKAGEVGCFLSHYYIWEEVVKYHHEITLVLEDDVRFVPFFRSKFLQLLEEIKELEWDLVYIGRKILTQGGEEYATAHTIYPFYSYWTVGYLISERGARKLLRAEPLDKMLPVDEFLPIMFDQHPNETWKSHFHVRDLNALSAEPLLIHPTHYTGQEGYISDTEDSAVVYAQVTRDKNEL